MQASCNSKHRMHFVYLDSNYAKQAPCASISMPKAQILQIPYFLTLQ